jgi:hypothetical protein
MYGNFSSKVWGGSKNGRVELIFYGFNFENVCVALCEEWISLCFIQRAYMISTKVWNGGGGGGEYSVQEWESRDLIFDGFHNFWKSM